MNASERIDQARNLLESINQFANIGLNLAEKLSDGGGREALVRELGQAAVGVLTGSQNVAPNFEPWTNASTEGSRLPSEMDDGAQSDSYSEADLESIAQVDWSAAQPSESSTLEPGEQTGQGSSETVQTLSNVFDSASNLLTVANPALVGAQMLINGVVEISRIAETETTERAKINAWRDTTVARIDATREVIRLYIERSFDERRENFDRLFAVLDRAQDEGSLEQMQLALTGILELVKTSPFKDFASFKDSWENPNTVWEL
jgi:hypothetical protein